MGTLFVDVSFDLWDVFPDETETIRKGNCYVFFRKWAGSKWVYEVRWLEEDTTKNVGFVFVKNTELGLFSYDISSGYNLRPDGLTLGEIGRMFNKILGIAPTSVSSQRKED